MAVADRLLGLVEALEAALARQRHPQLTQLSFNQIQMLTLVGAQPGISQRELATQLDITPASVSVAISKLESMGFVERRADPQDRRAHAIYPAPHGLELARQYHDRRAKWLADVLAQIDPQEGQAAVEALERALLLYRQNHSG